MDPQWSEERGAFLAAFTERNQGKLILLLRAKCWDSSPPSSPPCPPHHPQGSPYLAASPGTGAASPGLSSIVPPNPACSMAACHRPSSSQSCQGWKGLNTAAQLGKLSSILQPLQPLPPLLPSAVPSLTFAPPARKQQDIMVPCASLCAGVERLPPLGRGSFGHSEPPVRVFASWVHRAWT